MKAFVFAMLIFSLMIGAVIYNYFEINKISRQMTESVESLPPLGAPECAEACLALRSTWEKHRDLISFSCGISRLDAIDDLIDTLVFYSGTELRTDFELTRIHLKNALEGIAEFESFRPQDIF